MLILTQIQIQMLIQAQISMPTQAHIKICIQIKYNKMNSSSKNLKITVLLSNSLFYRFSKIMKINLIS